MSHRHGARAEEQMTGVENDKGANCVVSLRRQIQVSFLGLCIKDWIERDHPDEKRIYEPFLKVPFNCDLRFCSSKHNLFHL